MLDGREPDVDEGEIVGLLGRSGSGKSTLLRLIAGLARPERRRCSYLGQPVVGSGAGHRHGVPELRALSLAHGARERALGLEALRLPRREIRQRALEAIDLIGLDGFESAYPRELSGGMRQRVGFARALVVHPNILLMDEPFSALDVLTAETLRTDFLELWCEGRMPIKAVILVTHNIEEAVLMCDRILVFASNPGPHRERDQSTCRSRATAGPELPGARRAHLCRDDRAAGAERAARATSCFPDRHRHRAAARLVELADRPDGGGGRPPLQRQGRPAADRRRAAAWRSTTCFRWPKRCSCCASRRSRAATSSSPRRAWHSPTPVDERKKIFARHLLTYVPLAATSAGCSTSGPATRAQSRFFDELEDYMTRRRPSRPCGPS